MRGPGSLCVPVVMACACGTTTQPVTPAPAIEIDAVTILFDGDPIARLHADGTSESVGGNAPGKGAKFVPGPVFHDDGRIELTHGNYQVRVAANGDLFIVSPPAQGSTEQLEARLTGNQIVGAVKTDSGVRLEGDKLIMFSDGKATGMIGAVSPPNMGRTALIMSEAFLIDLAISAR